MVQSFLERHSLQPERFKSVVKVDVEGLFG